MTNSRTKKRLGLAVLCALTAVMTSGCSWLNTGEEEFSCSGMPGSIYCHSARDVYAATNDGTVPTPVAKDGAYNEDCEDCVKAEDVNPDLRNEDAGAQNTGSSTPRKSLAVTDDELINNYVTPALPDRPVPIRTPSQVMRIWVAPYVDTKGDLQSPGFIYTEIEPRRWIIRDGNDVSNSRVFAPLEDVRDYYLSGHSNQSQGASEPGYNSLERYKKESKRVTQ
jgi:conjugal transfer pilus assembly protein TraV